MQNAWIKSVSVSHFRGIERGVLTFTNEDGNASSTFLLGDNGSGKSSFLEAIVYGLTSREPHFIQIGRRVRVDPRNRLASESDETSAQILLEDGRIIKSDRTSGPIPEFELVSLLIKRDHLLAFGRSDDDQRGKFLHTIVDTRFFAKAEQSDREVALSGLKGDTREAFSRASSELAHLLGVGDNEMPGLQPHSVQIFRTAKRITAKQIDKGRAEHYGEDVKKLVQLGERMQKHADEHERVVNQINRAATERRRTSVIDVLTKASDRLNSSFFDIAYDNTKKTISRIELSQVPDSGSVALSVVMANGQAVPASTVLSEAYLDLASLLAIIALIRNGADRGQTKVLILDDVFHSVDNSLRDRIADYLFQELADWQLIIAFHDRAWFERFSDVAKSRGRLHVRRRIWTNFDGAVCVTGGYNSSYSDLLRAIGEGDFNRIPSIASRLLEELFESISMSLRCKVIRNDGDKYTLGDLTPGIEERCSKYSAISAGLTNLGKVQYMRNLVGAHSTHWAEGFTDAEANEFGLAVRTVYELLVCQVCNTPLRVKKQGVVACRCGLLQAA